MAEALDADRAHEIIDRRRRSMYWLQDNFYAEWETVFKSYKCERDPELNADGTVDTSATSIGLPDTWSHVRRNVARGTAQPPNIKYRCQDPDLGEKLSLAVMYQWDRGRVQRTQKKHFTQAALFGWSVRAWHWAYDSFQRTKRVDPMQEPLDPATLQAISDQYGIPARYLSAPMGIGSLIRARLLAKKGRGGLLPVRYDYVAYEGPRAETVFIGDCYPEPNFQTIQKSNWFIVERRRNADWMNMMIRRYPDLAKGFAALQEAYPDGTPIMPYGDRDVQTFRQRLNTAINRTTSDATYTANPTPSREWAITEQHTPGVNSRVSFVGQNTIWLGEIDQPYDLDGRIPFTELVLIDDLLCGIGDSTARIIRGLQHLHDRQANIRFDLVDSIQRPLYGTTDPEIYEQPDLLKRYRGMRLVKVNRQQDLFSLQESAAISAVAVGMQDDSGIERLLQKATGDSNMSMASNVDPQQGRTATGARIMAYNSDVLTKDIIDQFEEAMKDDAEMMFLLNRSELPRGGTEFNGAPYVRASAASGQNPNDIEALRQFFIHVDPQDFQVDGEVIVEAGSTLADDDEAKTTKATNLLHIAMQLPQKVNLETAVKDYLISMGKAKDIAQWIVPDPPPAPPELKESATISIKFETLPEQAQASVLQKMGIAPPPPPPQSPTGPAGTAGPDGAGTPGPLSPGGPPPGGGEATTPPPALVAASALAAAKGNSPFQKTGMPS